MTRNFQDDDAAFERFFKEHFYPLCTWCRYKFGFDEAVAKEVVHTAFIKLWKTRASISSDIPLKAYLHKIIINTGIDVLKRAKVKEKFERYMLQHSNAALTAHLPAIDLKHLQADIEKAIAELPDQMRTVFELSRYEGLKYAEIAERLHISVNTVETQMARALKKLREKLAGYLTTIIIFLIINLVTATQTFF